MARAIVNMVSTACLTMGVKPSQNSLLFFLAPSGIPHTLPPSVEEAYRVKCMELRQRTLEIEENNNQCIVRKARLERSIHKMRLERAYLLEMLGKRMKKSTSDSNLNGYDETSEGSSEGPPTPNEKPLRTKRGHRRPIASPAPAVDGMTAINSRSVASDGPSSKLSSTGRRSGVQKDRMAQSSPNGRADLPGGGSTSSFHANVSPSRTTGPKSARASNGNNGAGETTAPRSGRRTNPFVPDIPPLSPFHLYLQDQLAGTGITNDSSDPAYERAYARVKRGWATESDEVHQQYEDEAQQRQLDSPSGDVAAAAGDKKGSRKSTQNAGNDDADEDVEMKEEDEPTVGTGSSTTLPPAGGAASGGFATIN